MAKLTRPKIILLGILLALAGGAGYFFLINPKQTQFHPAVTLHGKSIGGEEDATVEMVLAEFEKGLETEEFALTRGEEEWKIPLETLGVGFAEDETRAKIEYQSTLGVWDQRRNDPVPPSFHLNVSACEKALNGIKIPYTGPQDAAVYYDGEVKIKAGKDEEEFRPAVTCNAILATLKEGQFSSEVKMFTTAPKIQTAHLEAILPQVQGIVSQPVALTNGSHRWEISPAKLFSFLTFTRNPKKDAVEVGWSAAALDRFLSAVAADTDSNNPAPHLGRCETLIWTGGYRLEKTAVKNFLKNLKDGSPRTLTLKVDYFASSVKKIKPVSSSGQNGSIYLTYDDGMTYSGKIMNLAACYGVKVTFFVIGSRAGVDAAAMRRAIANGHAVQSHGYIHDAYSYATGHSYSWQYNDIQRSVSVIQSITGVRPTYFRPPGGNHNANTYKAAAANGVKVILWGVTSIDTVYTSPTALCRNVLRGAAPNRSVLAHSNKSATVAALPCVVEGLARAGYSMKALW